MTAGTRPAGMGRSGRSAGWFIKRLLVVAVLVALIGPVVGYFTIQSVRNQIDSLIGQGGSSVTLAQHPSSKALDKDINTYWLADKAAGKTTVTATFPQTTELAGLIFHVGATADDYAKYGRPHEVQLSFPGDPKTVSILLNDDPGPQQRCLSKAASVRTFDVRIVSSYPPQSGDQNLVALREMEFISGSCP